jgi:hypothetical protein
MIVDKEIENLRQEVIDATLAMAEEQRKNKEMFVWLGSVLTSLVDKTDISEIHLLNLKKEMMIRLYEMM